MRMNVAFVVLLLSILASPAEQTNVLDWWTSWKYFDEGFQPPGDWTAPDYDDSQWLEGLGILGAPQNELLPTSDARVLTPLATNTMGSYILAHYFRTRFTLANTTTLTFTNAIDDGAILYLDGAELTRFAMPPGAVDYATLSTQSSPEIFLRGYDVVTVQDIAPGEHVLAVEVHQSSTNSSDVIFGLKAVADLPDLPPVISRQPQDQIISPNARAVFTAEVTGTSPIRYQWYANDVPLPNATSPTYQTPGATLAMNGWLYHLVATNSSGSITSRQARLTVRDSGPLLVRASEDSGSNRGVLANFDRAIDRNPGTNSASYHLREIGSSRIIAVTNVNFGPTFIRVWLADVMDGAEWMLVANAIAEGSTPGTITTSEIPVARRIAVAVPVDSPSRWSIADPGPGWQSPGFNDSAWLIGSGVFHSEASPPTPCYTATSTLVPIPGRTAYFRKSFNVEQLSNPTNAILELTNFVDDGAVFYLNGVEIYRFNMPVMPMSDSAPAYTNVEPARCIAATVSTSHVVSGTNVLAVEVHQSSFDTSGDIVFALAFAGAVTGAPSIPTLPTLAVSREGNTVTVTSSGAEGFHLESAPAISGPWTTVTMTNSRYESQITPSPRFFRLASP